MDLTAKQARRLLLCKQGLGFPPAGRGGPAQLDRMITQLGFVQLDSITAVERAHHLTLRSRLPSYTQQHLKTLLESKRSLFEHWTHDASVIPIAWRHHWKHRFDRYGVNDRTHSWWSKQMGDEPDRAIRHVLGRIRAEGPLRSRDFDDKHNTKAGWWNWKPAKAALEYLWRSGRISVTRRDGFQKVYDLSTRVHTGTPRKSSAARHVDWACGEAMDRLGIATARELAGYFRAVPLATVHAWIRCATQSGDIIPVQVLPLGDAKPTQSFARPTIEDDIASAAGAPLLNDRGTMRLLCPFDPVIRDRNRLDRLFGVTYRFEAFVPKIKRQYGYYVLPILRGDEVIGRADIKTDRVADRLLVQGVWWEDDASVSQAARRSLQRELESLAHFVGVSGVSHPS
jgi:uncharacterized protein YcaQ